MMLFRCFNPKPKPANSSDVQVTTFKEQTFEFDDDPRIPLTRRQKYLLIKNWKGIDREVSDAGTEMFLKMFSLHPEYIKIFPFRNIATSSDERKRMDDCLRQHAEGVMKYIGQIIANIGDVDTFFELINENGRRHARKNYFQPKFFQDIKEPFLYSVKLILGERYTENMDTIYKTVITILVAEMEKSCEHELTRMKTTKH